MQSGAAKTNLRENHPMRPSQMRPILASAGRGDVELSRMSSWDATTAPSPSVSRRALVASIWSSFSPADREYLRNLTEADIERYQRGSRMRSPAFEDSALAQRQRLSIGTTTGNPLVSKMKTSIFRDAIQKKSVGGNWKKAITHPRVLAAMSPKGEAEAGPKTQRPSKAQSNWIKARGAVKAVAAFVTPPSRPLPSLQKAVEQARPKVSKAQQRNPQTRNNGSSLSELNSGAEGRRASAQNVTASFRKQRDPESEDFRSIRSISSSWENSEREQIRELAGLLSEEDQDEIAYQILTQRAILLRSEERGGLSYLQARIYPYLSPEPYTLRAKRTEKLIMCIVLLNVVSMIVSSEDQWFVAAHRNEQSETGAISRVVLIAVQVIEYVSFIVFVVEYILRIWVCTIDPKYYVKGTVCGRLAFMTTKSAIVDLIALVPSILEASLYGLGSQSLGAGAGLRLWRVGRILKLENYARAFVKLQGGFSKQGNMFRLVLVYPMVALIVFATVLTFTETRENGADEYVATFFTSIPRAMFPVLLMLSGEAPLVDFTPMGQIVVMCISLFSVLIVATATGILASGFEQAVKENEGVSVVLNEARRQLRKHIKAQVDRDTKRRQKRRRRSRRMSRLNREGAARSLQATVQEQLATDAARESAGDTGQETGGATNRKNKMLATKGSMKLILKRSAPKQKLTKKGSMKLILKPSAPKQKRGSMALVSRGASTVTL